MLDPILNLAIFVLWWWVAFFGMLPIGVRSAREEGSAGPGHDAGAPHRPDIGRKALWAAGAGFALWALTALIVALDPFQIRPLPISP